MTERDKRLVEGFNDNLMLMGGLVMAMVILTGCASVASVWYLAAL